MVFTKKREGWGYYSLNGRKNSFKFSISGDSGRYWVMADHSKKDIHFNSLWEDIKFKTEDLAKEWCESFKYTNHACNGEDI